PVEAQVEEREEGLFVGVGRQRTDPSAQGGGRRLGGGGFRSMSVARPSVHEIPFSTARSIHARFRTRPPRVRARKPTTPMQNAAQSPGAPGQRPARGTSRNG